MSCELAPDAAGFHVGGLRAVMEASARAALQGRPAALALVLETLDSCHARAGTVALFEDDGTRTGWISADGLEPMLARHARQAMERGRMEWVEFDTRHDEALFSESASGCRGRLRIALLPLRHLPRWATLVHDWQNGMDALELHLHATGQLSLQLGSSGLHLRLGCESPPWCGDGPEAWSLRLPRPTRVLIHGAGPECGLLLPLLTALGFHTARVDGRAPANTYIADGGPAFDAVLVMHHHFVRDTETLRAWSRAPANRLPAYIGLPGPAQRREDLFRLLPPEARETLAPRLHSPVGLPLGGRGPEAIPLSIAAQLQAFLHAG